MGPDELNYSFLDRLIHRLAFAAPAIQLTASDMEKTLYHASWDGVSGARPIFITSLPRAGTTLMLEAFHLFPSLASHLYRDMPFVMAPVLWSRLSGGFRKQAELHERAHGDGMQVGYDSPEAFEEIIWRAFWPEKYSDSGIALWGADDAKAEADAFFAEHMKKIIALRRPERAADARYISKNNANIARLDLIGRMFPDAKILVPVRAPVEQAISLLRQHRNFIDMHEDSPFVRRYMSDIGHYEFGALHRPIAFPGLDALTAGRDPLSVDYWLGYWIAGFDYVASRREHIIAFSYEATCRDGAAALAELCERAEIEDDGALGQAAALFRPPPPPRGADIEIDPELFDRALALHQDLVGAAPG